MHPHTMNKDKWIELFRAIHLSDEQMKTWHHEFEVRYPHEHQKFLEWLHLPDDEIARIRTL